MPTKDKAAHGDRFRDWFAGLKKYSGFPAKGTISGALVILDRLKKEFTLDINAHTAKGGSQISGASGDAVRRILAEFGETRPFVSEGGRTNRGLRGDIRGMLEALEASNLKSLPQGSRAKALEEFQKILVKKVQDFHNQQRLKIPYDSAKTTWQAIFDLLQTARETNKEGPVAQYLIGAKLQIRFPDHKIENQSYSTADQQLNRPGDFLVGNTAFHVTVAPMPAVFDKCKTNVKDGLRVYLLVPARSAVGAKQIADQTIPGQISVEAIESFVAQNIDELSEFSKAHVASEFRRLLETYNSRVDAVEIDKSMMIEMPKPLLN